MRPVVRIVAVCGTVVLVSLSLLSCPSPTKTNVPPQIRIVTPIAGESFTRGEVVEFTAEATDYEDKTILEGKIAWKSSVHGNLGAGSILSVGTLSVGSHVISATCEDSQRNTAKDEIIVTIEEVAVPAGDTPVVSIISPLSAMSFLDGTEVTLKGAAVDAEDGELTGTSLSWSSSIDGDLGTGGELAVPDLSVGNHVITLTAVDSGGSAGSAQISLAVVATVTPTVHSGTITTTDVWVPQENPHVITGELRIAGTAPGGATLTIQPGCVVKLGPDASIRVGYSGNPGVLNAPGTEAEPIIITCNLDTPQAGWWKYIAFDDPDMGSVLQHCIIEYGGGDTVNYKAAVANIGAANVTLEDCTVRNSAAYGLDFSSSTGDVTLIGTNTFTGNADYGIRMYAQHSDSITGTTSVAGNTLGGVYLRSGTIGADTTWHKLDAAYVVEAVSVYGPLSPVLTIEAGAQVSFAGGASLTAASNSEGGKIVADGSADPITFTGVTQSPGFWDFIAFRSQDTGSELRNCIIEYGGGDTVNYKAAVANLGAANVTLENCTVRNSYAYGLDFSNSTGDVTLTGTNVFTGNADYGIRMYAEHSGSITSTTSVAGNTLGGVYLRSDTISSDTTWYKLDAPYVVESVSVYGPLNPVLTIEAGTQVNFTGGASLTAASSSEGGKIIADGSADPITFTGVTQSPGFWDFIAFRSQDTGSELRNCIIEYGGGDTVNYKAAVANIGALSAVVNDSSIGYSGQHGVTVTAGSLDLDGTSFTGNGAFAGTWYDINVSGGSYTGTPAGPFTESP